MCYELGNWFDRVRAKELHKAHEKADEPKRSPSEPAPPPSRPREEVTVPEKSPA